MPQAPMAKPIMIPAASRIAAMAIFKVSCFFAGIFFIFIYKFAQPIYMNLLFLNRYSGGRFFQHQPDCSYYKDNERKNNNGQNNGVDRFWRSIFQYFEFDEPAI